MLKNYDTKKNQIIISLILGIILGYIYQYLTPSVIVINTNKLIDDIENNSFKDNDKCYRYKKTKTKCN